MKQIALILIPLLSLIHPLFSQVNNSTWQDLMLDQSPTKTLQEVKDAFYAEWDGKVWNRYLLT